MHLLEIRGLKTHFATDDGWLPRSMASISRSTRARPLR